MSNYAIESYQLHLNGSLTTLTVVSKATSVTVATYNLVNAFSISTEGDNYQIEDTTIGDNLFCQQFNPATSDTFGIQLRAGIGVSDLRTTRCEFNYDLDACPIILKNEDGPLGVYSPCTGSCTQPSATCCTITEID